MSFCAVLMGGGPEAEQQQALDGLERRRPRLQGQQRFRVDARAQPVDQRGIRGVLATADVYDGPEEEWAELVVRIWWEMGIQ